MSEHESICWTTTTRPTTSALDLVFGNDMYRSPSASAALRVFNWAATRKGGNQVQIKETDQHKQLPNAHYTRSKQWSNAKMASHNMHVAHVSQNVCHTSVNLYNFPFYHQRQRHQRTTKLPEVASIDLFRWVIWPNSSSNGHNLQLHWHVIYPLFFIFYLFIFERILWHESSKCTASRNFLFLFLWDKHATSITTFHIRRCCKWMNSVEIQCCGN